MIRRGADSWEAGAALALAFIGFRSHIDFTTRDRIPIAS
jgi:hypothetical protein